MVCADDKFDAVVCTLALCTIPDPVRALVEVRRVCKTGGRVLLLEHVRLDRPFLGRLQDALTPAWRRICDGCQIRMLRDAGFEIARCEAYYKGLFLEIEATDVKSSAREKQDNTCGKMTLV